jgi:hypothetical protein
MVWVLSGNRETYFRSFHLKINISNFSLKLHSMTNNASIENAASNHYVKKIIY